MKPFDWPVLADENIHPDVVIALTGRGRNVRTVTADGLGGRPDVEVLRHAHDGGRVVLTHDSDFGRLAVAAGEPFIGIIHVRPGHIVAAFTLETIAAIEDSRIEVAPPFLLVAERRGDEVRMRLRSMPQGD